MKARMNVFQHFPKKLTRCPHNTQLSHTGYSAQRWKLCVRKVQTGKINVAGEGQNTFNKESIISDGTSC